MKCRYFFWVKWKLRYGQASPFDLFRAKGASPDLKLVSSGRRTCELDRPATLVWICFWRQKNDQKNVFLSPRVHMHGGRSRVAICLDVIISKFVEKIHISWSIWSMGTIFGMPNHMKFISQKWSIFKGHHEGLWNSSSPSFKPYTLLQKKRSFSEPIFPGDPRSLTLTQGGKTVRNFGTRSFACYHREHWWDDVWNQLH